MVNILIIILIIIGCIVGTLGAVYAALYIYIKMAEKDFNKTLVLKEIAEGDIYGILKIDDDIKNGLMLDLSAVESKGIIVITSLISSEELDRDIENQHDFIQMSTQLKNMDELSEIEKETAINELKNTIKNQINIPTFLGHGIVRMNEEGSLWDYQVF